MTKKLYVGKVWRFVYTIIDRRTTQKIYTGKHCTGILDDDYWGSGKYVNKKALEARGGTKNYIFQIEQYAKTNEELNELEVDWIHKNNTLWPNGFNLTLGGDGGWTYVNSLGLFPIIKEIQKELWEERGQKNFYYYAFTKEGRRERSLLGRERLRELYPNGATWPIGKKHSQISKLKIGLANKIKQKGQLNSQFGTMWITNNKHNIKIKKNAVIPKGYVRGRVMSASSIG
tara:strand:+ start:82 stop:771 length:690 start_codon:yes stop_codon:yes gene_type:complete